MLQWTWPQGLPEKTCYFIVCLFVGAKQLFWGDLHSENQNFQPLYSFLATDIVFAESKARLNWLPHQSRAGILTIVATFLPFYDNIMASFALLLVFHYSLFFSKFLSFSYMAYGSPLLVQIYQININQGKGPWAEALQMLELRMSMKQSRSWVLVIKSLGLDSGMYCWAVKSLLNMRFSGQRVGIMGGAKSYEAFFRK